MTPESNTLYSLLLLFALVALLHWTKRRQWKRQSAPALVADEALPVDVPNGEESAHRALATVRGVY